MENDSDKPEVLELIVAANEASPCCDCLIMKADSGDKEEDDENANIEIVTIPTPEQPDDEALEPEPSAS